MPRNQRYDLEKQQRAIDAFAKDGREIPVVRSTDRNVLNKAVTQSRKLREETIARLNLKPKKHRRPEFVSPGEQKRKNAAQTKRRSGENLRPMDNLTYWASKHWRGKQTEEEETKTQRKNVSLDLNFDLELSQFVIKQK